MQFRRLAGAMARVAVSALFAGLFYFAWLAAFLAAFQQSGVAVKAVLWLIAPVFTAAGFAAGLASAMRLTKAPREGFLGTFLWPLVGCTLGAAVAVWFGPMLIVFGMFLGGTGSVALREVIAGTKAGKTGGPRTWR